MNQKARGFARRVVDKLLRGSVEPAVRNALDGWQPDSRLEEVSRRLANIERQTARAGDVLVHNGTDAQRAAALLRMLEPRDAVGARYVRLGRDNDGGYVMVADLLAGGVAYSLGISDDVSWDRAMAERGYDVFQYDHTIETLPESNKRFRFEKTGICGFAQDDEVFRSLDTLIARNGHAGRDDLVLKIDIEGAEWDVFSTILDSTLLRFSQIVVEFHWFDKAGDNEFFGKAYAALSKLGTHFVPVHVHANNHYDFRVVGGVVVPPLVEVTYIRRGTLQTDPCTRTFPTDLDQPNWTARPDLWLGSFKFPFERRPGVTREEIERGYRLILGREPENEAVYNMHSAHADYDALVRILLSSTEYRSRNMRWRPFYDGVDPMAVLLRHEAKERKPVAGSIVNFLGVSTDLHYVSWAQESVESLPVPGNFHATEAEWTAALRAVELAKDHFTVVELGAGWGCWIVNTAVAAKRRGMSVAAIGVEGDQKHIGFMKRHCVANGLSEAEFAADEAVAGTSGGAAFPVYDDAGNAYGQEPRFFETERELDAFLSDNQNYRKVPAKTLGNIFADLQRVDLLHIDIQGGEEEIIRKSVDEINAKVAYIVVGTHGRDLEGQIMALLLKEGWVLEIEEPCTLPLPLRYNIGYIDGLQGWRNPRLTNVD